MELRFTKGPRRPFRFRGRVAWRRLRGHGNLKAGIGVEFILTERMTRDAILEFARNPGAASFIERTHERVQVALKIQVKGLLLPERTERTGDLSEGGVFVSTPFVIPVGEELQLRLRAPWSIRGLSVRGRVTWHRPAPERGMGVMFLFTNDEERQKVAGLVAKLQQRTQKRVEE